MLIQRSISPIISTLYHLISNLDIFLAKNENSRKSQDLKERKRCKEGVFKSNENAKRRLRAKRNGITANGVRKRYMCLFTSILGNDKKGCEIVWFRKAFTM